MIKLASTAAGRYTGINPRELERFLKFAIVGVIGALIDFGSFNLLRSPFLTMAEHGVFDSISTLFGGAEATSLALGILTGVSFMLAVMSNFLWNRYWTYPESRSKSKRLQMSQFAIVNAAGFVIRPPIFAYTHQWFGDIANSLMPNLGLESANWLGDNICLILIVGTVMIWNFFVNRYWTYADVDVNAESALVEK
ncbi:MAG: putative flippase GtrA [Cellvibrionaceae bacterium]|jgi:putative flippase GtrA